MLIVAKDSIFALDALLIWLAEDIGSQVSNTLKRTNSDL